MQILSENLIIHLKEGGTLTKPDSALIKESEFESFLPDPANAWDQAHQLYSKLALSSEVDFIEPDIINELGQGFPNLKLEIADTFHESFTDAQDLCLKKIDYDLDWPSPVAGKKEVWHIQSAFSQLLEAREEVAQLLIQRSEKTIVRIAHFDTGYDRGHITYPADLIRLDLQKNYTGDGDPDNAGDEGMGANGGHGCGTLSVLAGGMYDNDYGFKDTIGLSAAHGIEIVPVRIAHSVVLFKSRAFEKALEYVIGLHDDPSKRCHIITMSMGGAPTRNWARLVNKAYDLGIFIVTASGNNFGGVTPRTLVYPARFNRVIAACGATHDKTPYYKFDLLPHLKIMQGNYGPRRMMRTAVAAFTPNVPWARFGCEQKVDISGAGTSSATPQVAAAAALYYQKYFSDIEELQEGWQKVEVIRKALFASAGNGNSDDKELYFGNGTLRVADMLEIKPLSAGLVQEKEDSIFLPVLGLLADIVFSESFIKISDAEAEMYELEIQQLILQSAELQQFLDYEEKQLETLSPEERTEFIMIIIGLPQASEALKKFLAQMLA
ncbi:S8/S53 family peptidase [Mucilaginibacter sp. cycad4]|uniref:S8/S53 family peptidase n=1 Tax=Mucilaginibacter sp. cycad4 TaxID=3342096 RepID=UPI002AAC3851|nr:S8/S53 family peptidase [Mucilaginibacter gossypii]WPU99902.1 S8/S53 family peptidase [Mucilaginibacter gossypii]